MKPIAAALATAAVALVAPAAASAATLAFEPAKPCYRNTEQVDVVGSGFSPSGSVDVARDGTFIGALQADPAGNVAAPLTGFPIPARGEQLFNFTATDTANPAFAAALPVRVSALDVGITPKSGKPSRVMTMEARGFTTGRTLWVHVRRGRNFKRHVKVGRLKGPCHKLTAKRRLLQPETPVGTYQVQFDTFRRYKANRDVRVNFTITVFTRPVRAAAAGVSVLSRARSSR